MGIGLVDKEQWKCLIHLAHSKRDNSGDIGDGFILENVNIAIKQLKYLVEIPDDLQVYPQVQFYAHNAKVKWDFKMDKRQEAKQLLTHYFTFVQAGSKVNWDYDNQSEIESIVDLIVDAAVDEMTSLMIKYFQKETEKE